MIYKTADIKKLIGYKKLGMKTGTLIIPVTTPVIEDQLANSQTNYLDITAKLKFHKERVINMFVKYGVFPDNNLIADTLSDMDTNLSFLQTDVVVTGNEFDADRYNNMLHMLSRDLELLYSILQNLMVNEYQTLKAFVDTHLDELEDTANKYRLKAEQETNSTSLGKTILFKNSGFDLYKQDNITVIDLGEVQMNKGSRISCFMNANNIEADKIVFKFKKGADDLMAVNAYNYNQDSIVIPGSLSRNSYETIVAGDQIINGPIEMNLDGNKTSDNNSYIIMGGKNQILIKTVDDGINQFTAERPTTLNMLEMDTRSFIDFYIVGGNSITFRFNKKPVKTNFPIEDYRVTNLNHIHHFFIECEAGFAFDFDLDGGEVYAVKENGSTKNNKLYYSRDLELRDFYIEEYCTGLPDTYNAFVKIINDDGEPIDIESIYIKELVTLGVSI